MSTDGLRARIADAVMAVVGPELARLRDEATDEFAVAARLMEDLAAAVWFAPNRMAGQACVGGTRVLATTIAGLAPDTGLDGVADFYPSVSAAGAAAAVAFVERYIPADRVDELAAENARLRADLDAATRFSIPAGLGFVEVRKDPALDSRQWSTHRCDFDGRRIRETWETHPDRDAALARAREIAGGVA
jgi:uncharacterized protein (DUF433 family)